MARWIAVTALLALHVLPVTLLAAEATKQIVLRVEGMT
jgi:hypothetical protein